MIGEKFVTEPIVQSQAIEIVPGAQHQVMSGWYKISQTGLAIEASEIERGVLAVIKNLFLGANVSVKSLRDSWIVKRGCRRRDHHVADLTAVSEGDV